MQSRISRRALLRSLGYVGAAGVFAGANALGAAASTPQRALVRQAPGYEPFLWSDPRAWAGGRVPGPDDVALVDGPVVVDGSVRVAGIRVERDGALVFSPHATTLVESSGNVVVNGRLVMRPSSAAVTHTLRFVGVDEARFVGGGMGVMDSDVGLWVVDHGTLDAVGSDKTPWTRLAGAAARGVTQLRLERAPTGWRAGDELQVVPTLPPTAGEASWRGYSDGHVTSVSGDQVGLSRPTAFEHPVVNGQWRAEVLNLSRNVRIEGTASGRAHVIFAHVHRPQTIRNVEIRHMGPRQRDQEFTRKVLGRYGLHFHMSGDATRGSVIENVVVRDTGTHAFVAHESHGLTFRGCISHNTFDDAYWWDSREDLRSLSALTNDTLYEDCIASRVQSDPAFRGFTLAGFNFLAGHRNAALGCVAVGIQGNRSAAGFVWPELHIQDPAVWTFRKCVAHNNKVNGIFTWQNSTQLHVVEHFTAYHNGSAGIEHGAYVNRYQYRDILLFGNAATGVLLHSHSIGSGQQLFERLTIDGAGFSPSALTVTKHTLEAQERTRFSHCTFTNHTQQAVRFPYHPGINGAGTPEQIDFVRCSFGAGEAFWLHSDIASASSIRVQTANGAFELRRADQPGEYVPAWNARRTPVPDFA